MLKVDSSKTLIKRITYLILSILIAIFVIRVAIWEHNYYSSQQGKERAKPIVNSDILEINAVDETEIPAETVKAYSVPADQPKFLTIEKLGIYNARIIPVGVNSSHVLQTPSNIFDAGWYTGSSKPGNGGTAILDGHNGGPTKYGIFKRLPELQQGDLIKIELGSSTVHTYKVYDNLPVPLNKADDMMSTISNSPIKGQESISIITCTGEWSDLQKTYLSRQFLRAVKT